MTSFFWLFPGIALGLLIAWGLWLGGRQIDQEKIKQESREGETHKMIDPTEPGILVPIFQKKPPLQAIHFGIEMARHFQLPLYVVALIEIPRIQSINGLMGEDIEAALLLLERIEHQGNLVNLRIKTTIVKSRDNTFGLIETARTLGSGWIILEQPSPKPLLQVVTFANEVKAIQSKTNCNMIILNRSQTENLKQEAQFTSHIHR